jgi:hypothetical protein
MDVKGRGFFSLSELRQRQLEQPTNAADTAVQLKRGDLSAVAAEIQLAPCSLAAARDGAATIEIGLSL